jgi:hypothetical protein
MHFFVGKPGAIGKGLLDIFSLQVWILAQDLIAVTP